MKKKGTLFWITGLSGAGKTTISKELKLILENNNWPVVLLDGDDLRKILKQESNYSPERRLELASTYSRLCKHLTDQGINVICSTISLFPEIWDWNKKNIQNYKEIFIDVPIEILIERDQKGLYTQALNGDRSDVMGISYDFKRPTRPTFTFVNDGQRKPADIAHEIFNQV